MEEEERFEIPNAEIVKPDPSENETYRLSEHGMLLSQERSVDDERKTTAVPPSSDEEGPSQAVVGTTHYSNVRRRILEDRYILCPYLFRERDQAK